MVLTHLTVRYPSQMVDAGSTPATGTLTTVENPALEVLSREAGVVLRAPGRWCDARSTHNDHHEVRVLTSRALTALSSVWSEHAAVDRGYVPRSNRGEPTHGFVV